MQAVVLAAGSSSRFAPFTDTFAHKSLVKIMGKTILEHLFESLKKSGVTHILLVVQKKENFEQIFGDGKQLGLHIQYIILPEPLGMGAALLQAKEHLENTFFLLNTNHVDFAEFAHEMQKKQHSDKTVVLLGKKEEDFATYGFMKIADEKVVGVVEKPKEPIENALRIIGIYLLNKSFVEILSATPMEHYNFEKALDTYASSHDVRFIETDKKTISLKYAWDLFAVKDYLLQGLKHHISKKAKIASNAEVIGDVYIEDGVTVLEGVCIKGPAYIGKNAFIGTNSLIRNNTVIEEDAVVGSYMEMKNTLLMDRSTTHTGIIEDSIIGKDCKIATSVVTANVRLDRKKIWSIIKGEKVNTGLCAFGMIVGDDGDFGVRVTTMPGIIIGKNVTIGPSTTVRKNISADTRYYVTFADVVEEKKTA